MKFPGQDEGGAGQDEELTEDAGADMADANMFGDSPLHLAAEEGDVSAIEVRPC